MSNESENLNLGLTAPQLMGHTSMSLIRNG